MPVVLSPIGIALAALFVTGLSAMLWWMLHVPPPVSVDVARAVHSLEAAGQIMIPILDRFYSERAVELASRLAQGQPRPARILLAYVIAVPRTMPLEVPLPVIEQRAQGVLEDGQAIARRHGLSAETMVFRTRDPGEGIIRTARSRGVDLMVLGIRGERRMVEDVFSRAASLLLRRAPCEVILDYVPVGTLPVEPDREDREVPIA